MHQAYEPWLPQILFPNGCQGDTAGASVPSRMLHVTSPVPVPGAGLPGQGPARRAGAAVGHSVIDDQPELEHAVCDEKLCDQEVTRRWH